MSDCKCEYLKFVGDGDRRLYCPNCRKMYVLLDGESVEIEDAIYTEEIYE
jgi:hypothetical protein